jgi:site-specific DNA-methyltransferase (adenine-specific)
MIIHGNAIDELKKIQKETVDCIIADPPYNIGKDFGNNKTKQQMEEYIQWTLQWYDECKRILKPSGTMFIYGFSEVLAHISVNIDLQHRWLVWHYTNKTVPSLNFWQRSHESVLCVWKDKSQRVFNRDEVREPYTDTYVKGYKNAKRTRPGTKGRFGNTATSYVVNDKGALPRDVLKVSSLAGGSGQRFFYSPSLNKLLTSKQVKQQEIKDAISHPTQKPIALTEKLLDSCVPEDPVVVVPFSGTGSEGYVCEQRGYRWTSFELNKDYVSMGNLLIQNGFPKNKKKKA